MRLDQHAQGDTIVLSEGQIRLLERHPVEFRGRRVVGSRPGELLNQDSFYWGTLKAVGKVYVRVVVDVFCSLAHARAVIEAWRQEYNNERPKRPLGGLTPAQYAKRLAARSPTMPADSKSPRYR